MKKKYKIVVWKNGRENRLVIINCSLRSISRCHRPSFPFHCLLTRPPLFCLVCTVSRLDFQPHTPAIFSSVCPVIQYCQSTLCKHIFTSSHVAGLSQLLIDFSNYRILIIYCMSVVSPWVFAHGWNKWYISNIYSHYNGRVTINGKVSLSVKLVKNTFIVTRCS